MPRTKPFLFYNHKRSNCEKFMINSKFSKKSKKKFYTIHKILYSAILLLKIGNKQNKIKK